MLGLPAPERERLSLHALPSRLATCRFRQGGWQITYHEFRPVSAGRLPARLSATAGDVRVRIVVDDWQLPTP